VKARSERWINWVRQQEFGVTKKWLEPKAIERAKILELGGGNGLLAKCLADIGFDVVSIDTEPAEQGCFPVRKGDCIDLEFDDNSFDVIFSSNVLEHVSDLNSAFSEMKRVLKDGGIMVHTMPTHYSTIYTLALQPIGYFLKLAIMVSYGLKFAVFAVSGFKKSLADKASAPKSRKHPDMNRRNISDAIKYANPIRLLISWPHGSSSNCFTEIRDWRPESWRRRFGQAGFAVKEIIDLPLAYSRHDLFSFKFMKARYWLAGHGKSACAAYLIQC